MFKTNRQWQSGLRTPYPRLIFVNLASPMQATAQAHQVLVDAVVHMWHLTFRDWIDLIWYNEPMTYQPGCRLPLGPGPRYVVAHPEGPKSEVILWVGWLTFRSEETSLKSLSLSTSCIESASILKNWFRIFALFLSLLTPGACIVLDCNVSSKIYRDKVDRSSHKLGGLHSYQLVTEMTMFIHKTCKSYILTAPSQILEGPLQPRYT